MNDGLFDRLENAGKLPTPPRVVLKLLELTRREDAGMGEIADTLAQDPGLAAKILRFANSPMAGIPREVTSLQQAVVMIGARGVTMMALSCAVLSTDCTDRCKNFSFPQFGAQSLSCAVAAKAIAGEISGVSEKDAFLAGLLSQIGRCVLAAGIPEEYDAVLECTSQAPLDLPPFERAHFDTSYAEVGARLLRGWSIPELLCVAIEQFRRLDEMENPSVLAKVLVVAELAASIICPATEGVVPDSQAFIDAADRYLGIGSERCADLMKQIATATEDARGLLGDSSGRIRPAEEIESQVRERIAELSLAMHLENRTMARQQDDLMRRATTDGLTGVGNRAAFDARLSLELERSVRGRTPFALLMIDVDNFKSFNDTHGHQAGDLVLQTVAQEIDKNVRKVDFVARYGGEEFAVIIPDAKQEGVHTLAERLRAAANEAHIVWNGKTLGVTISIGAATFEEILDPADQSSIVKAADEQLYAAKCAGRNCVSMVAVAASGAPA